MVMGDGQGFHKKGVCVCVAQLRPTPCDPVDCSLPGSSIHGILQARTLEWITIPFTWVSSQPRNRTWVSWIAGNFFTIWAIREDQNKKCIGIGKQVLSRQLTKSALWWLSRTGFCLFVSKVYSLSIGRGALNTVCYYITITVWWASLSLFVS